MMAHLTREELADQPIDRVAIPGKVLQARDPAARARRMLANGVVRAIPVLDGDRYVGSVDAGSLRRDGREGPVGCRAQAEAIPTARAGARLYDGLALLDASGGTRLVVLAEDGETYLGIVCLRGDRRRLCVETDRLLT